MASLGTTAMKDAFQTAGGATLAVLGFGSGNTLVGVVGSGLAATGAIRLFADASRGFCNWYERMNPNDLQVRINRARRGAPLTQHM